MPDSLAGLGGRPEASVEGGVLLCAGQGPRVLAPSGACFVFVLFSGFGLG